MYDVKVSNIRKCFDKKLAYGISAKKTKIPHWVFFDERAIKYIMPLLLMREKDGHVYMWGSSNKKEMIQAKIDRATKCFFEEEFW